MLLAMTFFGRKLVKQGDLSKTIILKTVIYRLTSVVENVRLNCQIYLTSDSGVPWVIYMEVFWGIEQIL